MTAKQSGIANALVALGFALFLVLLSVLPLARTGVSPEALLGDLAAMRDDLEALRQERGGYPDSGGAWRVLPVQVPGGFPRDPAGLPAFGAQGTPPPVCALYKSDGADYKLIGHVADKSLCRSVRDIAPGAVDPVRQRYFQGAFPEGSWRARDPREREAAKALLRDEKIDPRLDANLRGVCWAFGYWSPGALFW